MTEIPEHLLKRSKERRSAMSGEAGAPAESSPSPAATPAKAAAAAPAAAAAAPKPEKVEKAKPVPAHVAAARTRKKVPFWALPVVAALPIWLFMYAEAMSPPVVEVTGPLAGGEEVYGKCAGCHGGAGQGGVGLQLNAGEVLLTFPSFEDHYKFIVTGSQPYIGVPYGNPDRPGGQRVGVAGMPAWNAELTAAEIMEVVCHERFTMQGNDGTGVPEMVEEFTTYCAPDAPEFLKAEEEGPAYEPFANPQLGA